MKQQNRNSSLRKNTKAAKNSKRRIDLSACKLVAPYGRDLHSTETLNTIATKMGKVGMRSANRKH